MEHWSEVNNVRYVNWDLRLLKRKFTCFYCSQLSVQQLFAVSTENFSIIFFLTIKVFTHVQVH